MKVFVTGASGHIGSKIVQQLIKGGHRVTGLARNNTFADKITAPGAEYHGVDLKELPSIEAAVRINDAVVRAILEVARGTNKVIIGTGGSLPGAEYKPYKETGFVISSSQRRVATEAVLLLYTGQGVRPIRICLPPITHGWSGGGFVVPLVMLAKKTGYTAYVGTGNNIWAACNVVNAARCYVLALEKGIGVLVNHPVQDQLTLREIKTALARKMEVECRSLPQEESG